MHFQVVTCLQNVFQSSKKPWLLSNTTIKTCSLMPFGRLSISWIRVHESPFDLLILLHLQMGLPRIKGRVILVVQRCFINWFQLAVTLPPPHTTYQSNLSCVVGTPPQERALDRSRVPLSWDRHRRTFATAVEKYHDQWVKKCRRWEQEK